MYPAFAHFSLNCSSLSVGTPVKVNPTQDSLFSKKRGLIWAKHTWTTHIVHSTGPRVLNSGTQHWPQGPQQRHTALAPGSSTAAHNTGPRALGSCTQHWPQGPQQRHTALAPGSSTAAHSTGPRVLNSCTQHWPQGPQQRHTALAPGSATAAHCNKQVSLWSRKGRQLQPSSSAMVPRKCHTSS